MCRNGKDSRRDKKSGCMRQSRCTSAGSLKTGFQFQDPTHRQQLSVCRQSKPDSFFFNAVTPHIRTGYFPPAPLYHCRHYDDTPLMPRSRPAMAPKTPVPGTPSQKPGSVLSSAAVTLLHIASPIPVVKPGSFPEQLPRFWETLPHQKRGVSQNS